MVQMQDVLGLGSEARMNTPGSSAGAWKWRLDRMPTKDHGAAAASRDRGGGPALDSGGPMAAPAAPDEILDVNRRYHDVAADDYDAKWGISFGEIGRHQVLGKVTKLLGERPGPFARSLEIGSGTGYFSLNLMQDGVIARGDLHGHLARACCETLERNARELGLEVETAACDAAALPFEDESFDLVLGHAVLHHLPDLDRAFAEFYRVLAPGRDAVLRRRAVAPRRPDRRRAQARGGAARAAVAARDRRAARARRPTATPTDDHALEGDGRRPRVRARPTSSATPRRRLRRRARARRGAAGELVRLVQPHARGDRRAQGHPVGLDPVRLPRLPRCCRRSTAALLEPRLPPHLFYNLMLAARKPRD